jgi:hypothetical protein
VRRLVEIGKILAALAMLALIVAVSLSWVL